MRTWSGVIVVVVAVIVPSLAQAQQPTCEQREQVLLQLIDNLGRQRSVITSAEIAEARQQVYIRQLEDRVKTLTAPPNQETPTP